MRDSTISDRLLSLPALSKAELCSLWRRLFTTDPPSQMRKELMLRVVGYRMQEQEFGGLNDIDVRRLHELGSAIEANSKATALVRVKIKPGTRLIRQWKDQVHVVNIEEKSFEYRGLRYESLSEIARFITGTRWSGPLFFGLKTQEAK